jgi:hypothetical protein
MNSRWALSRRSSRCLVVCAGYFVRLPPADLPNVAVTDFAASMVTLQVEVPEHAPLQPVNVVRLPALAVSVTKVGVELFG